MITVSAITLLVLKYVGTGITALASLIVSVFFGVISAYMSYWSLIMSITRDRSG